MYRIKICFLAFLCLVGLVSCSASTNADNLWIPIKGLTWGMELEKASSVLKEKGIELEKIDENNQKQYVLSKQQTCWGIKGTVKLRFQDFYNGDTLYLVEFSFYPEKVEEETFKNKLSKSFNVESLNDYGGTPYELRWESTQTLSDSKEPDIRQRAEDLVEMIWGDSTFHSKDRDMSRAIVVAKYDSLNQDSNEHGIVIDGEYAALGAFAKDETVYDSLKELLTK